MIATMNPTMKACMVLIPGLLLGLVFDPYTPLIYLIFIIVMTFIFTSISWKRWCMFFLPFVLLSFSFAWMTMLYKSETFSGGDILLSFWMFEITTESMKVAISLSLRSLCFFALSLLFVLTTDSTKFMLSLMQQLKFPPNLTFGILAGYRFLPTFQYELQILRQAHRIRGISKPKGIKGRLQQFRRYIIPLLAEAIRKAERVAIAMESKGFTGSSDRTHYYQLTVDKRDWTFLIIFIVIFLITVLIVYQLGLLNILGRRV